MVSGSAGRKSESVGELTARIRRLTADVNTRTPNSHISAIFTVVRLMLWRGLCLDIRSWTRRAQCTMQGRLAPAKCLHSETFTWSNNNHFSRLRAEHRWDYPPLALFPSAAGGAQGRVFRGDILCMCLTCVQQYLEVWPILGRSRYNQAKWSNQSKNGHKNWHILLVPMD